MPAASAATIGSGDGEGFVVSPAVLELNADAGDTATARIRVRNLEPDPLDFQTQVSDAGPGDGEDVDGGLIPMPLGDSDRGAGTWTTVTPEAPVVGARAIEWLTVRVAPPAGTDPGGYYAALGVELAPGEGPEGVLTVGATVLVLVTVGEAPEPDLRTELHASRRVAAGGSATWELKVSNDGSVHAEIDGALLVDPRPGGSAATRLRRYWVLPGETRTFTVREDLPGWPALVGADWTPLGESAPPPAAAPTVVVLPWWLLSVLLAAVATWLYRRHSARRTDTTTDDADDLVDLG